MANIETCSMWVEAVEIWSGTKNNIFKKTFVWNQFPQQAGHTHIIPYIAVKEVYKTPRYTYKHTNTRTTGLHQNRRWILAFQKKHPSDSIDQLRWVLRWLWSIPCLHTVDGSEIQRSPWGNGVVYPIIYNGFQNIPGGELSPDFWSITSICFGNHPLTQGCKSFSWTLIGDSLSKRFAKWTFNSEPKELRLWIKNVWIQWT